MKLVGTDEIAPPTVYSGHTDADLLKEVEHRFTTPGPLLRTLIHRFKVAVEAQDSTVDRDELAEKTADCPACGTTLKVEL